MLTSTCSFNAFSLKKMEKFKSERDLECNRLIRELQRVKASRLDAKKQTKMYRQRLGYMFGALHSLGLDISQESTEQTSLISQQLQVDTNASEDFVFRICPTNESVDLEIVWHEISASLELDGVSWGDKFKLETDEYGNSFFISHIILSSNSQTYDVGTSLLYMSCKIANSTVTADDVATTIESLDEWVLSVEVLYDGGL